MGRDLYTSSLFLSQLSSVAAGLGRRCVGQAIHHSSSTTLLLLLLHCPGKRRVRHEPRRVSRGKKRGSSSAVNGGPADDDDDERRAFGWLEKLERKKKKRVIVKERGAWCAALRDEWRSTWRSSSTRSASYAQWGCSSLLVFKDSKRKISSLFFSLSFLLLLLLSRHSVPSQIGCMHYEKSGRAFIIYLFFRTTNTYSLLARPVTLTHPRAAHPLAARLSAAAA